MAVSPNVDADGVISVTLSAEGGPVPDSIQVLSVQVRRAAGMIPSAEIVIADGDMPSGDWPVANSATFQPGAAITVRAGYNGNETVIFSGVVVRLGIRMDADQSSRLHVHCRDAAVTMMEGQRSASYSQVTDSDVMAAVIARNGLPHSVVTTNVVHRDLVQFDCSDWDFLIQRAEANGLQVIVTDGSVAVAAAAVQAPELTVTWGLDLLDFSAELDARGQFSSVTSIAWDPTAQEIATGSAGSTTIGMVGNVSAEALAMAVGPAATTQRSAARMAPEALDVAAAARQVKAALARLCGRMTFRGSAKASVGGTMTVAGVGERFSGDVIVSGLTHEIADGSWTTAVEFGVASRRLTERPPFMASPVTGRASGVVGLQTGIVTRVADDPDGEQRVAVSLPILGEGSGPIWARSLQPSASKGFGTFFMPEVGDEVVLGSFGDDLSDPVILGSVYSSNRIPPYAPAQGNDIKAIVTRSKSRIEINDGDVCITVATPANNAVVISDKQKTITISDENGNAIVTNPSGITLTSPKDISLIAKGAIKLDAVQGISVATDADVEISGLNIAADAGVAFSGRGGATAALSAGGEVVVRGALVKIN